MRTIRNVQLFNVVDNHKVRAENRLDAEGDRGNNVHPMMR